MTEKTKSLLVVDDDPAILQLIETAFGETEFQVLVARDGVEALKRIDASCAAIDVILVDVVMPRLNGSELARVVLSCHPAIKMIFMSGYPDDVLGQHGIPASRMRCIRKPFSPDMLLQTVRAELNR